MKEYQKRIVDEFDQLTERLVKLDGFLADTPSGIVLKPEERADMQIQSDVMKWYQRILNRRIGRF